MCIIAIKKSGTPIDWNMLDTCDLNNPDGAGYAYATTDGVVISKGYFGNDEIERAIKAEGIDTTALTMIFHFRIATHGAVNEGTCHPFPMTSDVDALTATDVIAPIAVAHNGIIPRMPNDKDLSDTMLFIRDYMAPLGDSINKDAVRNLISKLAASKLAIMTPENLYLIGDFIDKDGWLFSNDTYKEMAWTKYVKEDISTRGAGTSTDRINREWNDDDWNKWAEYYESAEYNDDSVLAYCDSCGDEYEVTDTSQDKIGDALWALCTDCTEQVSAKMNS